MSEAPLPSSPPQDPSTAPQPKVRRASRGALVFGVLALAGLFGLSTYYSTRPSAQQRGGPKPVPAQGDNAQRLISEIIEQQRAQNDQRRRRADQDRAIEEALTEQLAAAGPSYPPLPPSSAALEAQSPGYPQDETFYDPSGSPAGSSSPSSGYPSRAPSAPRETPQEARRREAMEAPILARQASAPGRSRGPGAAIDSGFEIPPFPAELTELIRAVTNPAAPAAPPAPPPRQEEPRPTPLRLAPSARLDGPTLLAGSVIPAVLTRKISSDLAGVATAMVSQDVLDSRTASRVVVPRGSLLLGTYRSAVAYGQDRLEIAWTRLSLPDGTTYDLAGMPAADAEGAAGVSDQVNRHLGRLYGSAVLLSLISAGAQLSQPDSYSGGSLARAPSATEVGAGALGQRLNDLSSALVERELNVRPTLTLRPGTPFLVSVTTDIVFPET